MPVNYVSNRILIVAGKARRVASLQTTILTTICTPAESVKIRLSSYLLSYAVSPTYIISYPTTLKMDDVTHVPPTDIDPYKVLGIGETSSLSEVKSAYRRLALQHHPGTHFRSLPYLAQYLRLPWGADKAQPEAKDAAHTKFQEIAFAYAILSNERRRKRYDITGNLSESLDIDDDNFNWIDFFRAQWAEVVTGQRINNFKSTYQNSDEERCDVLKAYTLRGGWDGIYRNVMLSDPLDDEERFRGYIDQAIKDGEAEGYKWYVNETSEKRERRLYQVRKQKTAESKKAVKHAKKLGVYDKLFGEEGDKPGRSSKTGADDLAAVIQQRAKDKATNFLDDLEAKYCSGKRGSSTRKKGGTGEIMDEPPEEAFEKTAARGKKRKARVVETEDEGNEEDEEDVEDSPAEETVARTKRKKPKRSTHSRNWIVKRMLFILYKIWARCGVHSWINGTGAL